MATCKRCEGRATISAVIHPDRPREDGNGLGDHRVFRCPDCKGTGEVSDDEPEGPADSKTNEEVSDGDA